MTDELTFDQYQKLAARTAGAGGNGERRLIIAAQIIPRRQEKWIDFDLCYNLGFHRKAWKILKKAYVYHKY